MSWRALGAVSAWLLVASSACWAAGEGPRQPSEYDRRYGYSDYYGTVTPRDVFALANNFNAVLDYYLETHKAERADAIRTLAPEPVSGKASEDLLVRSQRLADLVDELAVARQLPPVLRIERHGEETLPAEVFLQIGAILDGLIFYLSALDASQIWGDYYLTIKYPDEKTPDDAFSVLDLAVRKLELASREEVPEAAPAGEPPPDVPTPVAAPAAAAGA